MTRRLRIKENLITEAILRKLAGRDINSLAKVNRQIPCKGQKSVTAEAGEHNTVKVDCKFEIYDWRGMIRLVGQCFLLGQGHCPSPSVTLPVNDAILAKLWEEVTSFAQRSESTKSRIFLL